MTEEIKAIIEKNLPAQVGEVLKQALEQGQVNLRTAKSRGEEITRLLKANEELSSTIDEYSKKDAEYKSIVKREEDVRNREIHQDLVEAKIKLVESEKRATEAVNFVGMVFKSPIFRKTASSQDNWVAAYQQDGTYRDRKEGSTRTEETEID